MRKFNITVNGKAYEVEVEEVGAPSFSAPVARPQAAATAAPKAAPAAQAVAPVAPKAAPAAPAAGSTTVSAPMPGTIWEVKVAVGDQVSEG